MSTNGLNSKPESFISAGSVFNGNYVLDSNPIATEKLEDVYLVTNLSNAQK